MKPAQKPSSQQTDQWAARRHHCAPSPAHCCNLCHNSMAVLASPHRKTHTPEVNLDAHNTQVVQTHRKTHPQTHTLSPISLLSSVLSERVLIYVCSVYDMVTFASNSMSLLFSFCLPVTSS